MMLTVFSRVMADLGWGQTWTEASNTYMYGVLQASGLLEAWDWQNEVGLDHIPDFNWVQIVNSVCFVLCLMEGTLGKWSALLPKCTIGTGGFLFLYQYYRSLCAIVTVRKCTGLGPTDHSGNNQTVASWSQYDFQHISLLWVFCSVSFTEAICQVFQSLSSLETLLWNQPYQRKF